VLEEMGGKMEGTLRLRWLTAVEASEHEATIDQEDVDLIMENWV
jgi:hypothetical protein